MLLDAARRVIAALAIVGVIGFVLANLYPGERLRNTKEDPVAIREIILYKTRRGAWKGKVQGSVQGKERTKETRSHAPMEAMGDIADHAARQLVLNDANNIIDEWNKEDSN